MVEKKNGVEQNTEVANVQDPFGVKLSERLDSVKDALPADFNKSRFVQNCLALIKDNPEQYTKFGSAALITNLLKASYLGLDFYSKECYLVPYGDKLTFMPSYTGNVKLAKKYSIRPIKDIYSKLIREGDEFIEEIKDGEPSITFRPKFLNDGAIIGAFAVAIYKDGGMNYDVMSVSDLENTRKSSKASNSPAWKNFTGEMYKKTVLKRLCKHIELEFESASQQETYNEDMAIATDPQELNEIHVENMANSEEFMPFDVEESDAK